MKERSPALNALSLSSHFFPPSSPFPSLCSKRWDDDYFFLLIHMPLTKKAAVILPLFFLFLLLTFLFIILMISERGSRKTHGRNRCPALFSFLLSPPFFLGGFR